MDKQIQEVANLILIRNFVIDAKEDLSLDRTTGLAISAMQKDIDNKIINLLNNEKFKKYLQK